ncbi:MAG: phage protein [Gammaproteobacteria bacterium]|nr:phage protein [Gammaproteobacteria bacterium]MDX5374479.1 phage protein [Gammaproteobacteria bacterium]
MPYATWCWFKIVTDGLPLAEGWDGWAFRDGVLWSPENLGFTPKDIYTIPWLRQTLRAKRGARHSLDPIITAQIDPQSAERLRLLGKLEVVGLLLSFTYSELLPQQSPGEQRLAKSLNEMLHRLAYCQQETELLEVSS